MSSVSLPHVERRSRFAEWVSHVLASWRSITAREWTIALSVGALSALVGVVLSLELLSKLKEGLPILLHSSVWTMMTSVVMLLAWSPADRAGAAGFDQTRLRVRRLATALLVGGLISSYVLPILAYRVIGVPPPMKEYVVDGKKRQMPPLWVERTRSLVLTLIFGGLIVGVIEAQRRRRLASDALAGLQRSREELQRRALEARLAAMQARVEPQFLFDSLVDIDALYQRDAAQAAPMFDRLITYLRVALPQLRDRGSSARAEGDLVAAYLSVVAARRHGRPHTIVDVAPDAADARVYPMLLLPLVQRAVRAADDDAARLPRSVRLRMTRGIERDEPRLVALLRIEAAGQCDNDGEVDRLRERLAALYGNRATLECKEADGFCDFTLQLPYESAHDRPDSARR